MKNFKNLTIFLLTGLLLASCSPTSLPEMEETASPVADDFELELWQSLSSNGSSFELIVRSVEEVDCQDAYIDTSISFSSSALDLTINEIVSPSPCSNPGFITPTTIHALDIPIGSQDFSINIMNELTNDGSFNHSIQDEPVLNQTIDKLILELSSTDNLVVIRDQISLIPKGAIWGYIKIDDPLILDIAKTRISGLATHVYQLPIGDYGFFEIDQDQNVIVNADQEEIDLNFLIQSEADTWDHLADILGGIKEEYADAKTKFWHWDGQTVEY